MLRGKENIDQEEQKLKASKAIQTQLNKGKGRKLQASKFKENKYKCAYIRDVQFCKHTNEEVN